jgi:hypothetical protein
MIVRYRYYTVRSSAGGAKFLRSWYRGRRLQGFVNSASKFNSILVKTLKPVLCSFHDGVPLNSKRKLGDTIVHQCGSSVLARQPSRAVAFLSALRSAAWGGGTPSVYWQAGGGDLHI